MRRATLFSLVLAALLVGSNVATAPAAVIKSRIVDVAGNPVEGVKVFFYEGANVRKPADFISGSSDRNGQVLTTVPANKYQAVARLKKDALYGPLMPGDKHSGEPVEVDCSDNQDTEMTFTVADFREVVQKKRTGTGEVVRLWGRIVDRDGKPVPGAYVFAHSSREMASLPEYLSAWSDADGNYSLYLPIGGKLYAGAARQFPLTGKPASLQTIEPGKMILDIATDIPLIVY
jgi:hypothetical protein